MNLKRIIFLFILLSFSIESRTQHLDLLDSIVPHCFPNLISKYGDRYCGTGYISDSIMVNGKQFNLLPRDTAKSSLYHNGWPYMVGIRKNNDVIIKRHITTHTVGGDTSFISIVVIERDSMISDDKVFYNTSINKGGRDLLFLEYDYDGDLQKSKQWLVSCKCTIFPREIDKLDKDLIITGRYTGEPVLDGIELERSRGFGSMFTGRLSRDGEFTWIKDLGTLGTLGAADMVVNNQNEIMVAGIAYESSWVSFCGDTIASFDWGNNKMLMVTYDENGNCLHHLTMDYGEVSYAQVDVLKDDSYIVASGYGGTHIRFDSIVGYNSSDDLRNEQGFILKTTSELAAERLFQLKGSNGDKYIRSIAVDDEDNIWIAGSANVDTLIIGNKILTRGDNDQYIGFLSKLTSDFEHLFTFQSNRNYSRVLKGEDGYIYYMLGYNLYKIIDATSNIDDNAISNSLKQGFVYPNPSSDIINLEISKKIDQVALINTTGAIITELPATKSIDISNLESGLYFIKVQTSSGQYVDRFVVK